MNFISYLYNYFFSTKTYNKLNEDLKKDIQNGIKLKKSNIDNSKNTRILFLNDIKKVHKLKHIEITNNKKYYDCYLDYILKKKLIKINKHIYDFDITVENSEIFE